jgi:hypothetical protein
LADDLPNKKTRIDETGDDETKKMYRVLFRILLYQTLRGFSFFISILAPRAIPIFVFG